MRVLVVEDDRQISRQLVQALMTHGYVADTARNGEDGRFLGQTESYDAIILDLGLPVLDGLSVLQSWRQEGLKTPVLVLTARDTWSDKVKGLRAGADDYLAKPFHMEELIARVEALIRRDKGSVRSLLTSGEVQLDAATGRVTRRGEAVIADGARAQAAGLSHAPAGRDRLQGRADRTHLRPGLRQGFRTSSRCW